MEIFVFYGNMVYFKLKELFINYRLLIDFFKTDKIIKLDVKNLRGHSIKIDLKILAKLLAQL